MSYQEFIVPNRFKDKVTIITGAGSGIGKEMALRFAKEGSAVAIPDINLDHAREVAKMIEDAGGKAIAMKTDVSKPGDIKDMVAAVVGAFGKINILINNAGIVMRSPLADITDEEWNLELAVDLTGVALCIKYVMPEMIKAGGGKIVNISSVAALIGTVAPAYTAAKGGIIALSRVLVGELSPHKININTICPGFIATPLNEQVRKMGLEKIFSEQVPLGRMGTTRDIASAAVFLASDEADFISGAVLPVCGGGSSFFDLGTEYREFDKRLKEMMKKQ